MEGFRDGALWCEKALSILMFMRGNDRDSGTSNNIIGDLVVRVQLTCFRPVFSVGIGPKLNIFFNTA